MLSIVERWNFLTAVRYVVGAELSRDELEALRHVTFRPSDELRGLRGCFLGVQAAAGEREGAWRRPAEGTITVFLRSHTFGDLRALARTILHEIDHALGLNEAEVQRRDQTREVATLVEIERHRPLSFASGTARRRRPLRIPLRRPPPALG